MKKCKFFRKCNIEEVANVLLLIQYKLDNDMDYTDKKRATGFLKFMVCQTCDKHDIQAESYLYGEKRFKKAIKKSKGLDLFIEEWMAGNKNPQAFKNVKMLKNFHVINDDYFQGIRRESFTELVRSNVLSEFEQKEINQIAKNEETQKCIDETVEKVMYEIDNLKVYLKLQKGLNK